MAGVGLGAVSFFFCRFGFQVVVCVFVFCGVQQGLGFSPET